MMNIGRSKRSRNPTLVPAWEKAAMLAKYYVTTGGVALSRRSR